MFYVLSLYIMQPQMEIQPYSYHRHWFVFARLLPNRSSVPFALGYRFLATVISRTPLPPFLNQSCSAISFPFFLLLRHPPSKK